jgi:hypothetical protein
MDSPDVIRLLTEIRDAQREYLAEYRRVGAESLELSRRAVLRQEQFSRLYRRVLAVGAILLMALAVYLAWLVFRRGSN